MADIKSVTDLFAVAPQIDEDDFAQIADAGFRLVINNRPDGETFGQMSSARAEQAAIAYGLDYVAIPVIGGPTPDAVTTLSDILENRDDPILAYCRSGTRSCTLWTMAAVKAGLETPETAINKAREAGYDLSPLANALAQLQTPDD